MARPSHADAHSSEVHFWLRLLLGEKRELVSVPVTGVEEEEEVMYRQKTNHPAAIAV